MYKLSSDVNKTPKKVLKARQTWAEMYIGNNIEYDVKSSQVKVTILKRTKIRLRGLKLTAHRNKRWHGQRACDAMMQT